MSKLPELILYLGFNSDMFQIAFIKDSFFHFLVDTLGLLFSFTSLIIYALRIYPQ